MCSMWLWDELEDDDEHDELDDDDDDDGDDDDDSPLSRTIFKRTLFVLLTIKVVSDKRFECFEQVGNEFDTNGIQSFEPDNVRFSSCQRFFSSFCSSSHPLSLIM